MKHLSTLIAFFSASLCISQINTFYVQPNQTDLNYPTSEDSNLVVRNTSTNNNKLFLFIGGTGSNTGQYQTMSNFAGNLGYDVINLSYPNSVAAASLANSTDSLAFNNYRQELCFGTPLSPDVTVDSLNSIHTRTLKLITYLDQTYPTQNWGQYLINPTTLDWSKIAVGGHSQGAGHACYFAKFNAVERVLMFSGPNDYSNHYSNSANWLRTSGISAVSKHFVYLSLLDELVDYEKQLINQQGLGVYPLYDSTYVDYSSTPYSNSHCLYTTQSPGISLLYHNSTVKFSAINNEVWTYMLSAPTTVSTDEIEGIPSFILYPNPSVSAVTIRSDPSLVGSSYTLQNLNGQVISTGKITSAHCTLDLSAYQSGVYLVRILSKTLRFVKE